MPRNCKPIACLICAILLIFSAPASAEDSPDVRARKNAEESINLMEQQVKQAAAARREKIKDIQDPTQKAAAESAIATYESTMMQQFAEKRAALDKDYPISPKDTAPKIAKTAPSKANDTTESPLERRLRLEHQERDEAAAAPQKCKNGDYKACHAYAVWLLDGNGHTPSKGIEAMSQNCIAHRYMASCVRFAEWKSEMDRDHEIGLNQLVQFCNGKTPENQNACKVMMKISLRFVNRGNGHTLQRKFVSYACNGGKNTFVPACKSLPSDYYCNPIDETSCMVHTGENIYNLKAGKGDEVVVSDARGNVIGQQPAAKTGKTNSLLKALDAQAADPVHHPNIQRNSYQNYQRAPASNPGSGGN